MGSCPIEGIEIQASADNDQFNPLERSLCKNHIGMLRFDFSISIQKNVSGS